MPFARQGDMHVVKPTACGRFVVLDGLLLDREVYADISRWAAARGLRVQDAIQLALCALGDGALARSGATAMAPLGRAAGPPQVR